MTRSPTLVLLAFTILSTPALACGDKGCNPPPKPPPGIVVQQSSDNDSPSGEVVHYTYCCAIDGVARVGLSRFADRKTALQQCQARLERLQSLPECPRRIRRKEGGE